MRRLLAAFLLAAAAACPGQQPFTLQQILGAPYASELVAGPSGGSVPPARANLFAWVENTEGRRNLFIGGPGQAARQLTHNTQDDGQQITDLAWSLDGSYLAYTCGAERGADRDPANPAHLQEPTPVQVVVQPLAPAARPITIGEGQAPLFTRDGGLLFVRGGQIWIAGISPTEAPHPLVYDRGSAGSLTLSPDGSLLAFVSTRTEIHEPAHSFIGLYSFRSHSLRFLAPSTESDSAPTFSPGGRYVAWLRRRFSEAPEFAADRVSPDPWSIELAEACEGAGCAATARTLFSPPPDRPGSVLPQPATGRPGLFFVSPHRLVFYSEVDGWTHLYELDWDSGQPPRLLTPGPFEVQDAAERCDEPPLQGGSKAGREPAARDCTLFYAANDASSDPLDSDRRHLYKIDFFDKIDFFGPGPPVPQRLTSGAGSETQPQGDALGFAALYTDARTPAHVMFTARSAGEPQRPEGEEGSARPLHPDALPAGSPRSALVEPRQVLFSSTGGLRLHGQLFLPRTPAAAGTRRPALVFLHGGPRRQMLLGYPAMEYYSNAYAMNQYLVSRGFIVLSVNYRCGIGYGLDFRQCEHSGAAGAAEYNDVLAAVRYLRSRPDVDPARLGLWGGSYGGYLTELALARNSDLFAAGVSFHGIYDWNLEDNAADWLRGDYAQRDAIAAVARASSPIGAIDRWRSPVLLIHGDNDPEVAYAQTAMLAEALRARHLPMQELIFPGEVHAFLLHRDWLTAYQATAAFFERTLQP